MEMFQVEVPEERESDFAAVAANLSSFSSVSVQ